GGVVDLVARSLVVFFFFFQAEDGIRDRTVTGVQTCALPICHREWRTRAAWSAVASGVEMPHGHGTAWRLRDGAAPVSRRPCLGQIGRASCRERGEGSGRAGGVKKKEAEQKRGRMDDCVHGGE